MTAVEVFKFPATGQAVRSVLISGEPWFVARDVAVVLGYANGSRDITRHTTTRQRREYRIGTPSGEQVAVVINEPGVYRMVMRSNMPKAVEFQDWLAEEVLPAIRRTGRYGILANQVPTTFPEALRLAADQAEAIAELEPRAAQADQHRAADGLIAVGDLANKVKAWAKREHGVRVLHRQVWDFLGDINLIIRGDTIRKNHPTAFAIEHDYVRLKETTVERSSGPYVGASPRLTPAGEGYAWDRAVRRIAEHGSLERRPS